MSFLKNILGHSRWSASASIYIILLQACLYLIITRYIDPIELGIFALASSFIFIPSTIIENSFCNSLIQSKVIDKDDYMSVLGLNLISATFFGALIFSSSLLYRYFFGQHEILGIILIMVPVLFFGSFNSVHFAGLRKAMSFKVLSVIETISFTLYFVACIILAYLGFGYWSTCSCFVDTLLKPKCIINKHKKSFLST